MPKRNNEEQLRKYYKKFKRLERKIRQAGLDDVLDDDTQEIEGGTTQDPECETHETEGGTTLDPECEPMAAVETTPSTEPAPDNDIVEEPVQRDSEKELDNEDSEVLDPEVLLILGDPAIESPKLGPKISDSLSTRWGPILKKGLNKEDKENITKQYQVPANCELLQAPTLNPEIASAISDMAKNRDKKIEAAQQQLGIGITALGRAMSLAIKDGGEKIEMIKHMNNASKILTDLHFNETKGRKYLITPILDKGFLNIVKDVEHDEFLYGKNLTDKIKSTKSIERSSQSIKKADNFKNNTRYTPANKSKPGNFSGPPRYQHRYTSATRGTARGGFRRPALPPRRPATAATSTFPRKEATHATR